jgi:hypothetical protein
MDSPILHNIAGFICIFSFVLLTIGLIRPFIVIWWSNQKTRTKVLMVYGSIALVSSVIFFFTINPREDDIKAPIEGGREVQEDPRKGGGDANQ